MSDTATVPSCPGCGLSGGLHYLGCPKVSPQQFSAGVELGRAEMRELMKCGHQKACWVDSQWSPWANIYGVPEDKQRGHCSACACERRVKLATIEACAKEADHWLNGIRLDAVGKKVRAINPDDIKVKQ